MKLTNRERVLILLALVIGIIALYYQFILSSQLSNISKLKNEVTSLKTESNKYDMLNLKNLNESLTKVEQKINTTNEELPDYENIEEFIVSLDNIIASTGVNFKEINFQNNGNQGQNQNPPQQNLQQQNGGNSKSQKKYVEIPVNISVTGNYNNISAFISEIQKLKRINDIKSLEILNDKESDSLTLNMSLVIYSMNQKGGSYLKPSSTTGRSNPFKPLEEVQQNMQNQGNKQNNQQTIPSIDVNKIITDTLNNALKVIPPQNNTLNNNGKTTGGN